MAEQVGGVLQIGRVLLADILDLILDKMTDSFSDAATPGYDRAERRNLTRNMV